MLYLKGIKLSIALKYLTDFYTFENAQVLLKFKILCSDNKLLGKYTFCSICLVSHFTKLLIEPKSWSNISDLKAEPSSPQGK